MRNRWLLGLILLPACSVCQAQETSVPVSATNHEACVEGSPKGGAGANDHFWLQADYLLWWVKSRPQSVPLVTTGPFDPNTFDPAVMPTPAAINSPGTSILHGGKNIGGRAVFTDLATCCAQASSRSS